METSHSHVWMFPNFNDNCLLGGVLVMRKFDWKKYWANFDIAFYIVGTFVFLFFIIGGIILSETVRFLVTFIAILLIICGIIACFLTKHDEKS